MQDTEPMDSQHRAGDPPIKITREIPLPWLIGIVAGLIVQGVTVWIGQQTQGDAIKDMGRDLRELRTAAAQGGLQAAEVKFRVEDHERRLARLEQKGRP